MEYEYEASANHVNCVLTAFCDSGKEVREKVYYKFGR